MELAGFWLSQATFIADARGEVRLDLQEPVGGAYNGIDAMGLLWAMESDPLPAGTRSGEAPDVRAPVLTTFQVEQDGATVATATYRRWFSPPDIRITEIREQGMVGQLFEPARRGRRPAVLVLGGSEGGADPYVAAAFASKGYVALALAYFRVPGLPKELVNIPLEYFLSATEWLRAHPSVDPERIAVYGKSRGAEAALLLASLCPLYRVAIIGAPSSVTWAGVGPHNAGKPAWTYIGEPVRYVPNSTTAAALRAAGTNLPESIPIQRSIASVLLSSGEADSVWPKGAVTVMGNLIIERLSEYKHPYPYEHLSYADAGHSFGMFYLPGPIIASGGGSAAGNARAGADYGAKLWAFLRQNLDSADRRR
jgi:dienelactone hydrolase